MMLLYAVFAMTQAVQLFVSPLGDDRHAGTYEQPLASLDGARRAARDYAGQKVVVEFGSGTYRLPKAVVFSEGDSGDVTYEAAKGASVVFTGSSGFTPSWKPYRGKILQCSTPDGFDTDQLYVGGERQVLARYPNEDLSVRIFHGYAKDAISLERVRGWKDPSGGYLHAMHSQMWGDFHYRILGKSTSGELELEGGWQNNRKMGMHPEYRFVEGIFEELDAPGEWYLDKAARTLYLYPRHDVTGALVEGPQTSSLIEVRGAKGLCFKGFTFQQTKRTFMLNREPLLRSDWTIYRGGALYFKGALDCSVEDCVLKDLGGNAIFLDGFNRAVAIRRCRIEHTGANGVAFVGSPSAVRSPLFEYGERQSFAQMDKVQGPKSADYPAHCSVEDCLIHHTGLEEKQSAGVEIAMSSHITVRHCSIYHVPRAGINIGDGCWGGHLIEGCDVFDTVLETGDHGAFNSWGRDRYWGLTDVDMNQGGRPELAALDTVDPIVLRHNRWRCDHGWDVDLDDGSSRYVIEDNLCLNGGLKNREGYDRVVQNNIMVRNSFHPHVWFLKSGDVFRRNIVFEPYHPIGMPAVWGHEVDHNFLHTGPAGAPVTSVGYGSFLQGGADFVRPEAGDFRVKAGSPALRLGFKNFRMDDFGVRTPRLRALAERPSFLATVPEGAVKAEVGQWLGASVKDLFELGDISATGSAAGRGVLVTAVKSGSLADRLGLKVRDVILMVGGVAVRSVRELSGAPGGFAEVKIWRAQREVLLRFPD